MSAHPQLKNTGAYQRLTVGGKSVKKHIYIAERALGRALPAGAVVHHVNEIQSDNRNENLVICPNRAYHNLIHQRMRALAACGNANWWICVYCKQYDAPENLYKFRNRFRRHKACHTEYARKRGRSPEQKERKNYQAREQRASARIERREKA